MLWWTFDNLVLVAILAGIVFLACQIRGLSPAVRHALWVVVLIKMLTPPLFAWPWAIPSPLARFASRTIEEPKALVERPSIRIVPDVSVDVVPPPMFEPNRGEPTELPLDLPDSNAPAATQIGPPSDLAPTERAREIAIAATAGVDWSKWAAWLPLAAGVVWLAGAAAYGLLQLVRIVRMSLWLRRAARASPELVREVERMAKRLKMRSPPVSEISGVGTPFIWAVFRPRLLWPSDLSPDLSAAARQGLILHELAHVKRRDHWVGWLEMAAGCLWWWNPLFWYVRREVRENAELACDAWVVGALPKGRRAYAEALLAVCESISLATAPRPALGASAGGRRPLERRLTMILRANVPFRLSRGALLGVFLLCAAVVPAWSQGITENPLSNEDVLPQIQDLRQLHLIAEDVVELPRQGTIRWSTVRTGVLPAEARQAFERFEQAQAEARRDADRKVEQSRRDFVKQLTDLADRLLNEGRPNEAATVLNLLRQHAARSSADSGWTVDLRGRPGESFQLEVTGDLYGPVWGTDVYTDDSRLATAAVHAGVLAAGERGMVRVTLLEGQSSYSGSTRNGVTSSNYGAWSGSYRIAKGVTGAATRTSSFPAAPSSLMSYRGRVGETFTFEVIGSKSGTVWGTSIYTDDSHLATAAVHAGVLKEGEQGTIHVKILEGRDSYGASERNGVYSQPYREWGGSFEFVRTRSVTTTRPRAVEPDPGYLFEYQRQVGKTFWFDVVGKGHGHGSIWGTDVYTTDSNLSVAAVHAGLLREGERGILEVTILPGQDSYHGSTRNGISSGSWRSYPGSFRINSVQKSDNTTTPRSRPRYPAYPSGTSDYPLPPSTGFYPRTSGFDLGKVGDSREVELVGAIGGYVWGTEVYTSDSTLAAAAVHAGVLEVGEKAMIRVTILDGRDSYDGSTRHGISSASYGPWPRSIRLERAEEPRSIKGYPRNRSSN
jgi:beta-lactamase regulating signal transducer with metallopeptidase domain